MENTVIEFKELQKMLPVLMESKGVSKMALARAMGKHRDTVTKKLNLSTFTADEMLEVLKILERY